MRRAIRALLVLAVLGGLFLASTTIAQRLADWAHADRVATAQPTPGFHDTDFMTPVAAGDLQAGLINASLTDVDAVPADGALGNHQNSTATTALPSPADLNFYSHPAWLKGFDPPP